MTQLIKVWLYVVISVSPGFLKIILESVFPSWLPIVTDHVSTLHMEQQVNFEITNFKFQISNFKFQISKFQISKFNSNSQGGNTDTIFILRQTLLTETDRQKWFLYCHFIPLPRRAVVYLVILPWFMICKHIAGFPTKIELFQTRFSFGKKYFMKILNRCMASWLLHLQEYIIKIDYIYMYN